METCRSINTDNPQLSEIPLPHLAITVGEFPTAFDRFARLSKQFTTRPTVPFGMIQQALMASVCRWATGCSWHSFIPHLDETCEAKIRVSGQQ